MATAKEQEEEEESTSYLPPNMQSFSECDLMFVSQFTQVGGWVLTLGMAV